MKRFDFDENDDFQDPEFQENNPGMTQEEYIAMLERREAVDFVQLELAQFDLNQRLLFKAIKTLEKSWFWNFKSETTKLRLIADMYQTFRYLLSDEDE